MESPPAAQQTECRFKELLSEADVVFPSPPSDHCDGRHVDRVQALQSLPGDAQEPEVKVSGGETASYSTLTSVETVCQGH